MKHPQAGQVVKVTTGAYRDRYAKIINFFQTQFQGKKMTKLYKTQYHLLHPVAVRGYEVDEKVVLVQIYPTMEFICLHDKELQYIAIDEKDLPPNVTPIKKKEIINDAIGTGEGNSNNVSTGGSDVDGRSVPSKTVSGKVDNELEAIKKKNRGTRGRTRGQPDLLA